jgi:RNA polymerase primary sigma factor
MLKDKDLKEVQALIHMGKQRGFVTYEEMNNFLPTHLISADELDNVMIMFSELDIEVVNQVKYGRQQQEQNGQNPGDNDRRLSDDSPTARSNDPVRMYLRKMGTVPLLSREGEIEIAKRIEEGEQLVERNILTSAYTLKLVSALVEDEEERCLKAVRGGKKPRRIKTRTGKTLVEVREAIRGLLGDAASLRRDLRRVKARRTEDEIDAETARIHAELIELMGTVEVGKRSLRSARCAAWCARCGAPHWAPARRSSPRRASPARAGPTSTPACGSSSAASARSKRPSASPATSSASSPGRPAAASPWPSRPRESSSRPTSASS